MAIDLGTSPVSPNAAPTAAEALQINSAINAAVQRSSTGANYALIGGDLSGGTRGNNAIDIQTTRTDSSQISAGASSISFGVDNTTKQDYSLCVGVGNFVSGYNSSAYGSDNDILSGNYNSAFGYSNSISGENATAIGSDNSCREASSLAVGFQNAANGSNASVVGSYNSVLGFSSSALGLFNVVSGAGSICLGGSNYSLNNSAAAVGIGNSANGSNSSAFGRYVKTTVANSQEFGYWSNPNTRSSAIRLHGSGYATISVPKANDGYTDGGATAGSEADGSIFRKGLAFKVNNSNQLWAFYNDNGTIRSGQIAALS